ncbi:OstA-like protein [Membranihabitans maritimus]|uniref:OstA-like protein n=1 Tax=Membranihabitans maritimus TaxID=2904244 RepID=UPI001F1CCAA3|nr:OstA-like protein [Membranihabitans maritimus]
MKVYLVGFYCAVTIFCFGTQLSGQNTVSDSTANDSATTIILDEPADRARLFTEDGMQYQQLVGNVRLRHDSTFMRCDSAIIDENNQVEAYGNVVIQELDSTFIFSDTLLYDGNLRMAELLGEVILEKKEQRLFTDRLMYDLVKREATYSRKSYMTDKETQLSSLNGTFYVAENKAVFRDSVLVLNDSFNLKSDSLAFFTQEYRVNFLSPTILYNDTSRLYAERGFYLINEEEALFHQNAEFESGESSGSGDSIWYYGKELRYELLGNAQIEKEDKIATARKIVYNEKFGTLNLFRDARVVGDDINAVGDSLVYYTETNSVKSNTRTKVRRPDFSLEANNLDYDNERKFGYARGNVIWEDSSGMKRIFTDSLEYKDGEQYAKATSINLRPLFEWIGEEGDTMRLVSDTLITNQVVDSIDMESDSIGNFKKDTFQNFFAYHNVSILRNDVEGKADSVVYDEVDSLIYLFGDPVLWMDTTQLTGDTISIVIKNGDIQRVLINGNAFVITSPDSIFFNQIKGRQIIAFFEDGKLSTTHVDGNAESIYFPVDSENAYLGMNKIICSRIEMFFEENNVTGISFLEKPTGEIIEMTRVEPDNSVLKGFVNRDYLRPRGLFIERQLPGSKEKSLHYQK